MLRKELFILCITFVKIAPEGLAGSVAVSNLIQHNDSLFLLRNDEHPRVHFCTPLITMSVAPLRRMGFCFIAGCAYIGIVSFIGISVF